MEKLRIHLDFQTNPDPAATLNDLHTGLNGQVWNGLGVAPLTGPSPEVFAMRRKEALKIGSLDQVKS